MVDQLANDYASQPVVFLERNVYEPIGDRKSYFWAAFDEESAYFPMVMVDSGHQVFSGPTDYYQTYKQMVDTELARPPQAIQTRVGDSLHFDITVTNRSGVALSYDNDAMIHVIVYETAKVYLTNRYVIDEIHTSITSLANGATGHYTLDSNALSGLDWNKVHAIALVDYQPSGSYAYDMLQAAEAQEVSFKLSTTDLAFLIDPARPANPVSSLQTIGSSSVTWFVSENIPWLSVDAPSGQAGTPIILRVNGSGLNPGIQKGIIYVTASGPGINSDQVVNVMAYYGTVYQTGLPVIMRK